MSCAKKADNIETQPKTNSTTAIEVSKDLVEKVSMASVKVFICLVFLSFKELPK